MESRRRVREHRALVPAGRRAEGSAARVAARRLAAGIAVLLAVACGKADDPDGRVRVTFSGSAVGAEAEVLRLQLDRFERARPDVRVDVQATPDAADQRHQLYVQWLNARAPDPDVLQLDVIWTPEFAAAGWVLPLDRFDADLEDYFAGALAANRWRGSVYALPWFVDVGMLYWRSDLLDAPPATWTQLVRQAQDRGDLAWGLVWQGARYEGLVTVFVEVLAGFGGRILDDEGRVVVDSPEAVGALEAMTAAIEPQRIVPREVLTWHEEETRFAFQNGRALFMRNWPYAVPLLQGEDSRAAGRFAVALMPGSEGREGGAALGGGQLAINAHTDVAEAAWAVIEFLTGPAQLLERAERLGHYPARPSLYTDARLEAALSLPPAVAREIIEHAIPRPATPVYTELSALLQVRLHRALSGQQEPREALVDAAREMRALLERVDLEAAF